MRLQRHCSPQPAIRLCGTRRALQHDAGSKVRLIAVVGLIRSSRIGHFFSRSTLTAKVGAPVGPWSLAEARA